MFNISQLNFSIINRVNTKFGRRRRRRIGHRNGPGFRLSTGAALCLKSAAYAGRPRPPAMLRRARARQMKSKCSSRYSGSSYGWPTQSRSDTINTSCQLSPFVRAVLIELRNELSWQFSGSTLYHSRRGRPGFDSEPCRLGQAVPVRGHETQAGSVRVCTIDCRCPGPAT